MYNTQKIYDLLQSRNIRQKDLLEYLGKMGANKNSNGSLKQLFKGDMKASNVEKIADFFGLPIDYFFDRDTTNNGVFVSGVGHKLSNVNVAAEQQELKALTALLEEKDKRIKTLEDMIELLRARIQQ